MQHAPHSPWSRLRRHQLTEPLSKQPRILSHREAHHVVRPVGEERMPTRATAQRHAEILDLMEAPRHLAVGDGY